LLFFGEGGLKMIKGKTYDQIKVGDKAFIEKTLTETDVYTFAGIIGDLNPIHVNERLASKTSFGERICHGLLVGSFISTVMGMYLPGPGTIYLSQSFKFLAPVRIGDTICASVEVVEKLEKGRVRLNTTVTNQENKVVVTGEALVIAPKQEMVV
jgi:3-hydroxybutyryl-CoA dehydratase